MTRRSLARWVALPPALLISILFTGCGGANDTFSPALKNGGGGGITPDFTASVANSPRTIPSGATATFNLTWTAVGGFSSPVSLSAGNVPPGATATFNPATVTPTAAGVNGTLTVATTDPATPPGSYSIPVTATGGGITHSFSVVLNVTGLTLTIHPASQNVVNGGSVNYTVTVQAQAGFTGTVTLSVAGLPNTIGATFAPAALTFATGDGSKTSTLTLTANNAASNQTTTLTVIGTSGPTNASAQAMVRVNPSSGGLNGSIQ